VTIVRPLKVAMFLSRYLWRTFLKFLHGSKGRANRDVARCLHAAPDLLIYQCRVRISRVDEYVRPALAACVLGAIRNDRSAARRRSPDLRTFFAHHVGESRIDTAARGSVAAEGLRAHRSARH